MRLNDATIDTEIASLRGIAERLAGAKPWIDAHPSADLRARIAAIGVQPSPGRPGVASDERSAHVAGRSRKPRPQAPTGRRPRRAACVLLGAAACVVLGALGGTLLPRGEAPAITGPAGPLGALKPVDFTGEPAGVDIDAELVAHTWGTETVPAIDGLEVGADYTVALTDRSGGVIRPARSSERRRPSTAP